MEIKLIKCKRTDLIYQEIRNRHYVANRGTHGQQMHYKISVDNTIVGIISGASAVWAVKARDNFFGLTKENKRKGLPSIINNTRYNVEPHGFETFVVENNYRKGTVYKADNWDYLGETFGNTKSHKGLMNKLTRQDTTKKMIYAKKIPKTKLSTEYESSWNKLKIINLNQGDLFTNI